MVAALTEHLRALARGGVAEPKTDDDSALKRQTGMFAKIPRSMTYRDEQNAQKVWLNSSVELC